jgi:hypothetical protein
LLVRKDILGPAVITSNQQPGASKKRLLVVGYWLLVGQNTVVFTSNQ